MKNTITRLLSLLVCFMSFIVINTTHAQNTSIQLDGEEVQITQQVASKFLGTYKDADNTILYQFYANQGESLYVEHSKSDPFAEEYAFDMESASPLKWGILLKDGEPVKIKIHKYEDGQTNKYEALVFVYLNYKTGNYERMMLYENNGDFFLGKNTKKTGSILNNG